MVNISGMSSEVYTAQQEASNKELVIRDGVFNQPGKEKYKRFWSNLKRRGLEKSACGLCFILELQVKIPVTHWSYKCFLSVLFL